MSRRPRSRQDRLLAQNLASGEKQLLATDARADISGVLTDPLTGTPIAYSINYLKPRYVALDPALQRSEN